MMFASREAVRVAAAGLAMLLCGQIAAAKTPLDDIKDLYASASYEAALQAIDQLNAPAAATPEAQQFRTLLLLALGRAADAEHAAEALVTASPTLVPSGEEFPPRYVALITATRKRLLPGIIVRAFADARDQYRMDGHGDAAARFERVLALARDPAMTGVQEVADVRTLASGFLDLVHASDAPTATAAAGPVGRATAVPPAASPVVGVVVRSPSSPLTEPSVAIRQDLPSPYSSDLARLMRGSRGAVKLVIGVDGHVKSATIEQSISPSYDASVIEAARNWLYKPALLNGQPVESERILAVELKRP